MEELQRSSSEQMDASQVRISDLEREVDLHTVKIRSRDSELIELNAEKTKLVRQIKDSRSQVARLEARMAESQSQLNQMQADKTEWEQHIAEIWGIAGGRSPGRESALDSLRGLPVLIQTQKARVDELQRDYDQTTVRLEETEVNLSVALRNQKTLASEHESLLAQFQEQEIEIHALRQKLSQFQKELEKIRGEKLEAQQLLTAHQREKEAFVQQITMLTRQLSDLQSKFRIVLTEKQARMLQLEKMAKTREEQFRVQSSDLKRAQSVIDSLRRENFELKKRYHTENSTKRRIDGEIVIDQSQWQSPLV
jgi:chromosome segregation ATPase